MRQVLFNDLDYEFVEELLLEGGKFNELQKEFIEMMETRVIIAGPGAGKTTALAAKIILLLKHLSKIGSSDGICVITYTNVAVKEINTILLNSGVGTLTHPHFIGTIHEFFNKFCVIPFFKQKYSHNSLFFDKVHASDIGYYEKFLERNYFWMNQGARKAIAKRTHDSKLTFDRLSGNLDIENTTMWEEDKFINHKIKMLDAKIKRKSQGFLLYDDTFLFSEFYLYHSSCKAILRNRFKYIFVDEFQDTSVLGAELLSEVFTTEKNVLQMIGDPYQTIQFGQPMPDLEGKSIFRMNVSNRFGVEISNHLNIVRPESNIESLEGKHSFNPVILIYQSEKEIYSSYKKIVQEFELMNDSFRNCSKEDKVLVWDRGWTSKVKEGIQYKQKKNNKLQSKNLELLQLVSDFILKKLKNQSEEHSEEKKWLLQHENMFEIKNILLELMKAGSSASQKQKLKKIVNEILDEKRIAPINISNSLFNKIDEVLSDSCTVNTDTENPDDIYTIHAVKGETLRSVLVVNFENGPLTDILFHRYGVSNNSEYIHTNQNLLYVAMSRVTHLFIYALHKDLWTYEVENKLVETWDIRKAYEIEYELI